MNGMRFIGRPFEAFLLLMFFAWHVLDLWSRLVDLDRTGVDYFPQNYLYLNSLASSISWKVWRRKNRRLVRHVIYSTIYNGLVYKNWKFLYFLHWKEYFYYLKDGIFHVQKLLTSALRAACSKLLDDIWNMLLTTCKMLDGTSYKDAIMI